MRSTAVAWTTATVRSVDLGLLDLALQRGTPLDIKTAARLLLSNARREGENPR